MKKNIPLIFNLSFRITLLTLLLSNSFQSLAQLAAGQEKFLGNIMPSHWDYAPVVPENFGDYWNQVSPENAGKWGIVEGNMGTYNWADLDLIYNYAKSNNIPFRQHVMVWGSQQPTWMEDLTIEEQRAKVEEWFSTFAERYHDTDILEVANEFLPDHAPELLYLDAIGGRNNGADNPFLAEHEEEYGPYGTGYDFLIWSFAKARAYFPNAVLHINDYGVISNHGMTPNTIEQYLEMIEVLNERGLIDAVGLQCHYFNVDNLSAEDIQANLDWISEETGLPIYITELDITSGSGTDSEEEQRDRYAEKFPVFWEHPNVIGVTLWGYMADINWVVDREDYPENHGTSGLLNEDGSERLAMQWLRGYLESLLGDEVVITRQPRSIQVRAGEEASFEVRAAGEEPISYQWYFQGEEIDDADQSIYTIAEADESHVGEYYVVLSNAHTGEVISQTVTLSLIVQTPFNGIPHAIPGTIPAEEFDLGGQNVAYYDTSPDVNQGRQFRPDEGVDIAGPDDDNNDYIIAWIENNEWLEYTVNVERNGLYKITFRIASGGNGRFTVSFNGQEAFEIQTPSTSTAANWWEDYTYTDVVVEDVVLNEGEQIMRIDVISGGFNFNYMKFEDVTPNSTLKTSDANIFCYPNPSEDSFTLEVDGSFEYKIVDMTGNLLYTGMGENRETLGQDLPAGMYILHVLTDEGQKTTKLVKL
ncbi:MAG: endo-1,4-beta-xylanase [Cytophagaceae bacterium]